MLNIWVFRAESRYKDDEKNLLGQNSLEEPSKLYSLIIQQKWKKEWEIEWSSDDSKTV